MFDLSWGLRGEDGDFNMGSKKDKKVREFDKEKQERNGKGIKNVF